MKVALIAGSSRKLNEKASVERLYGKSPLFRWTLAYCKRNYDAIYVLSPKYGLLALTDEVEPYEEDLQNKQRLAFKEWLNSVVEQIKKVIPEGSELFFHAGKRHRKLISLLEEYQCHEPMKSLAIGKQMKWYKEQLG